MAIKAFKTYDLPEPPEPYVNESAATALAQGSITQPIVVDDGVIRSGAYVKGVSGWALNSDGTIEAMNANIYGTITAITGAIGGFNIGTSYIRDTANSFGMTSVVTEGDDIRFWAGSAFENRATAPFRVTESGELTAIINVNGKIESINYVSGALGAGFHIDENFAEFGNIAVRGVIRSAVFENEKISVMGGNFVVLDGDVLDEDII